MSKLIPYPNVVQQAFVNLKDNDPVRMAAATAFFAFFALPSIVVIISQGLGALFNNRSQSVSGQLFSQLSQLFGPQSARQIQDISQHLQSQHADRTEMVVTGGILLISSTTLFAVMKNSLNQLWNVRAKPQQTMLYGLKDRAVALGVIMASGLLFSASVTLDRWVGVPGASAPIWQAGVCSLLRMLLSLLLLTTWFAMLFTYLPDVRVRWPAVWTGAAVTSTLYLIGEMALTRLLTYSQLRSIHGGAGAITLVLLFVFYCSLIFYYGASFTRQYARWAKWEIRPSEHAVGYTITEIDEADKQ